MTSPGTTPMRVTRRFSPAIIPAIARRLTPPARNVATSRRRSTMFTDMVVKMMAFAIIFTTMSVNIVERRREVATLRAGGVSRRAIAGMIAGENLLVTLMGVVPGLVIGVLGGRVFLDSYSNDQFRLDLVVNPLTCLLYTSP